MPRDFKSKIDEIKLKMNKTISGLEKQADLGHKTLQYAYSDNRELSPLHLEKFLSRLNINRVWWDTGNGEPIEKKLTPVPEPNNSNENKEIASVYRDLVESNTDYRLIPKTILDGEYRIESKNAYEERTKLVDRTIAFQERIIEQLQLRINQLQSTIDELKANTSSGVPVSSDKS